MRQKQDLYKFIAKDVETRFDTSGYSNFVSIKLFSSRQAFSPNVVATLFTQSDKTILKMSYIRKITGYKKS